jgi:hydrogenase/urease accessory protein HupE
VRRGLLRAGVLAAACAAAASAVAHEVRPAYLEIRELGAERYSLLWKVPARGEMRLSLGVRLPVRCTASEPPRRVDSGGAITDRWQVACAGGLVGETVAIDGLAATLTDVLARVERADGSSQVARLTPAAPAFVVDAAPRPFQVAATYVRLGVEHILLGIDHLLFVLGLLILVQRRRRLIATITAFTAAHSITLAAATLGWLRLSQQPVEAVIALSIVFVASEIAHQREGRRGWTRRWPWLVAFCFGLLHGFGFAGALREVGLPEQSIPLALLCFNLGVEIGQLTFVAVALALASAARRSALALPAWAARVPAYGIGSLAAFWTIQRVAAFWP